MPERLPGAEGEEEGRIKNYYLIISSSTNAVARAPINSAQRMPERLYEAEGKEEGRIKNTSNKLRT
jgi:hypothetical protein